MKKSNNIWAVILSAIVVLGLLVGFFFLGYFSSAKGWIEIKESEPAQEELPEGETGEETGGETATKAAKAMGYTVSLKSDVAPFAITDDLPDIDDDMRLEGDCPKCGQSAGYIVLIDPTCTKSGTTNWKCSNCGTFVVTTPAAHNFAKVESVASTSQYCTDRKYTCTNCSAYYYALSGTTSRTAHHGTIVEKKASTCIEAGYNGYQCDECDHTWREDLPLADHTPDSGKITKYATCTEEGVMTYACTVCGTVDHTETIPKTAHKYTENGEGTLAEVTEEDGIVEAEPTCTTDGKIIYYCLVCNGAPQEVTIQATGHKWETVEAVEPTCTEAGHESGRQCSVCEEWFGGSAPAEIPALGHDWTEWTEDRESCDVAGERTRTCNRCQEVETEQLEAGAHSWDDGVITKAPTCTESGVRTKTCELCGDTMTETVDAVGHKPAKMAAVAATCTKTGLSEGERCTACGITLTAQQVIPALGHKMQHHAAVAATETTGGNIEYWQCNTCGVCYTDAEGKTQISAEDTLTPPLGVEEPGDEPGDEEPAEDKEGLEWWAWALIVAGAVVVIGLALVIVDQVAAKNKAKSNGGSKPTQGNGNNYGNNGGSRNNYNNYNGNRNHKNKGKKR